MSKYTKFKSGSKVDKTKSIDIKKSEEMIDNPIESIEKPIKTTKVVNYERLNVREEPSIESEILCIINKGSEVEILEKDVNNEFHKIVTSFGIVGYCMKRYLD